jgi:flagellar transcriptional activator FlhD
MEMNNEQLKEEIRDINLSYLMLAQQMIRLDRAQALFRLGITEEVAGIIEKLSNAQLLKMASGNMLMCRFRFDDELVWNLLASHSKDRQIGAGMHASILMAGNMENFAEAA